MKDRLFSLVLVVCALCFGGCSVNMFGAEVSSPKTDARPPNNVTVYLTVKDEGQPVGYLNKANFKAYENGLLLDSEQVGLQLLPRDQLATGHTLLLLDLAGSPSDMELTRIARGAAHFVEKVTTTQAVTVVAFDGTERAREIGRYAKVEAPTKRPLPPLRPFLSSDSSRDLNSAILSAISGLKQMLGSGQGVQYGTVVSLVRGVDLAGRKTDKDVRRAVEESGFEFFAIVPQDLNIASLQDIGRDEIFRYDTIDTMPMRFQDLGIVVRATWESHYLLSYCSPARAGERDVQIDVTFQNKAGKDRESSIRTEFNADGFTGGCGGEQKESAPAPTEEGEPDPEIDESTEVELPDQDASHEPAPSEDEVVPPPPGANNE